MARISDLDPPPGPITGAEKLPVVQGASTWGMPLGEFLADTITAVTDEAAGHADRAEAAATAIGTRTVDAERGGRLAVSAADGFEPIFFMRQFGAVDAESSATMGGRFAKFFDAGASHTADTIATGTTFSAVTFQASVARGAGRKYRVRVWQRPLTVATPAPGTTNPQLNAAPGAAGDIVISDTGLLDMPAGKPDNDSTSSRISIDTWPITAPVTVFAGFSYGIELILEDGAAALVQARPGRLTTAAGAQRFAGFFYTAVGSSAYTNLTTTRRFAFGISRLKMLSVGTVNRAATGLLPAVPIVSALTEMERKMLAERGAWREVKRPVIDTKNHGLARLMGNIPTATYGIDFGPRVAEASMTALSAPIDANWSATFLNLQQTNVNSPDGHLYERFTGPYVQQGSTVRIPVVLRDFVLRGHPNGTTPFTQDLGFQQQSGAAVFGPALVEYGLAENFEISAIRMRRGVLRGVVLRNTGQNGLNCGQSDAGDSLRIEGILITRPGALEAQTADPHGDGIESNACLDLSVVASVIYMPAVGDYVDNVAGQVNCIRHVADTSNAVLANSFAFGNLLVGCNPTMQCGLSPNRTNVTFRNMIRAFNLIASDGYTTGTQGWNLRRPDTGGSCTWANMAMFDDYNVNGAAMPFVGSALPASYAARTPNAYRQNEHMWGVFNWNKAVADARFFEALQLIGRATGRRILDSNNDLQAEYDLGSGLLTTPA